MATIFVKFGTTDEQIKKIESLVERLLDYDPNWNGATIKIVSDDFTYVECDDHIAGEQLRLSVQSILDGNDED